jgi:hypothetical protein
MRPMPRRPGREGSSPRLEAFVISRFIDPLFCGGSRRCDIDHFRQHTVAGEHADGGSIFLLPSGIRFTPQVRLPQAARHWEGYLTQMSLYESTIPVTEVTA